VDHFNCASEEYPTFVQLPIGINRGRGPYCARRARWAVDHFNCAFEENLTLVQITIGLGRRYGWSGGYCVHQFADLISVRLFNLRRPIVALTTLIACLSKGLAFIKVLIRVLISERSPVSLSSPSISTAV